MYAYISGTLVAAEDEQIIIDNHGIGYALFASKSTIYQLPHLGEQVKIYTYLNVKEDAMQLFGFYSQEELSFFKLLINVNGIGPKGALSILGIMSVDDLRLAILSDDVKAISKAPGIGNKTAQRVIIELKGNITKIASSSNNIPLNNVKSEVIEAMAYLGYSTSETLKAMKNMKITENDTSENILKEVLKTIGF
jgi:Holliday junction DNA helicase RuvA